MKIGGVGNTSGTKLELGLYNADDKAVMTSVKPVTGGNTTVDFKGTVSGVAKWSDDAPNLYTLLLTLVGKDGKSSSRLLPRWGSARSKSVTASCL